MMRVVAMLGGLGSQMFKYAFYLQIYDGNLCYIDTTSYLLHDMWNGYELGRIFGVHAPDIKECWTRDDINFFRNIGMNYKETGIEGMRRIGENGRTISILRGYCYSQPSDRILNLACLGYNKLKRMKHYNSDVIDTYPFFYRTSKVSVFYDEFNHTSDCYIGNGGLKERLRDVYKFPDFDDSQNTVIRDEMLGQESVAVHIRRSDHMYDNGRLFEGGYFRKAIQNVKRSVKNPFFYIFSDETEWCRTHRKQLGFEEADDITIVDWNKGLSSYKDMQLMTYCRHNILSISSFGWWGYYLSIRKQKIVCAPAGYWLEVPLHY